jgi:thiamine transport system ATP-binding protein
LVLDVQRVLREEHVTVLAVTHDRAEAFTLADRVAILREGRIAQIGPPDELWRNPVDDYVAGLVGLSVLDGKAIPPDGLGPDPRGPWELTVTGRAFSAGRYLVTGDVKGAPVTYVADEPPVVGRVVRIGLLLDGS